MAHRFAVTVADGSEHTGPEAIAHVVRALPAGPAFAWLFTAPGLRSIAAAVLRQAEGRTTRTFAITRPTALAVGAGTSRFGARFARGVVGVRELLALAFFVGALNQAAVELWSIKRRVKVPQPEVTRVLSHKLRFLQGWFMFSPNPVMDDGTIVVDAVTVDGRNIDPFWSKPPNFDLLNTKSFRYNQIWSDYFNRMHLAGNRGYRDAMIDYMRRLPERTGNPNDALVRGEVYWVHDMNPKWKTRESWGYQKDLLYSFDEQGKRTDAKADGRR